MEAIVRCQLNVSVPFCVVFFLQPPKVQQKSKEAKAMAASSGGKGKKKVRVSLVHNA